MPSDGFALANQAIAHVRQYDQLITTLDALQEGMAARNDLRGNDDIVLLRTSEGDRIAGQGVGLRWLSGYGDNQLGRDEKTRS